MSAGPSQPPPGGIGDIVAPDDGDLEDAAAFIDPNAEDYEVVADLDENDEAPLSSDDEDDDAMGDADGPTPKAGFADIHTPPPSCSSSSHRSKRQMYSHLGVPNFPSVFSSTLGTFDAKMAAPLRNFPPESMFGTCVTATLFVVLTMTSATYGDLFRTDGRCTTVQRTSGPKSINGSPDTCAGSASCFVVFARAPAARFLFTGMARRASTTSEARATRMLALTNIFHTRLFKATLRYY